MELHLVLAFDVSASVNNVEFELQRTGIVHALRSESVSSAIADAPGGIAIAIVQWSSVTRQALGLDWVVLHDLEDTAAYAKRVTYMPRRIPGGGTMIHSGLEFAEEMLKIAPGTARRQVIDVGGNGRTDDFERLMETRDRLLKKGIVINALAIEEDPVDLTNYFYQYLVGGENAFVVTANDFEDFGLAMQIKLYQEISGRHFSEIPDHPDIEIKLAALTQLDLAPKTDHSLEKR